MSKTDNLKEKYKDDDIIRTSLRMTAGRRQALKGMTKELGFPNQDEMIAYMVDYGLKAKDEDKEFASEAREHGAFLSQGRMTEKQKTSNKLKRLASLPEDELERLLAGLED